MICVDIVLIDLPEGASVRHLVVFLSERQNTGCFKVVIALSLSSSREDRSQEDPLIVVKVPYFGMVPKFAVVK